MTTGNTLNTGALEMAPDFVLSRNPEKAMQEMLDKIDALRSVYVEENDALLHADTMKFISLQDEKLRAAREYKSGTEQIIQRRIEFKDIDPALRQKLTDKHSEFSDLAAVNLEALARMRKSVQRLGDRIMVAARDAAQKSAPNYGASGNLGKKDRRVSIGINESA